MMIRYNNFNRIIKRSLFNYKDAFLFENQLSQDEKSIKELAHNFSRDILQPNIVSSFRNEQFDKIFDMFYRGSEKSKGNGLGLYLVRRAVHKLHGNITIESEEGKYSCFTIALPKVIVPKELKSLVN